jgi:signal transduction histidine kinase
MIVKPSITAKTSLQFFGKVSASISHEIKNVLAIINENAGLLDDFTFMADRGKPIDPERLKAMADAVKKQIRRADDIIKNMNRFAHSTDHTVSTVDLNETIELFIALTARFAAMKSVQVDLRLPENSAKFQTAPFFLMNLLWMCLDFSMSACGDAKHLELVAEEKETYIRIKFRRLSDLTEELLHHFPSDRERNLLEMLAADLKTDCGANEIVLRLSKNNDKD